jgi:hypothetical protein
MSLVRALILPLSLALLPVLFAADPKPLMPTMIPDDEVQTWVATKTKERQPSALDRRFDEIGWSTDMRTAIKLGKEHNRPIFLFTMDGRINTGRC